jgi:glucose/arabinose dehydrogenase
MGPLRSLLTASLTLAAFLPASAQTLRSKLVVGGLQRATWVGGLPNDSTKLWALEQDGRVRVVSQGALLSTPVLDINPIVGSLGNEQGLLSLAFDPGFTANGLFYVSYTDNNGATVVARYSLSAPGANTADPASAQVVFGPLPQPQSNLNGGCIAFGPDGFLYLGLGDGGGANDSGSGHATGGNAQSSSTYLGKLLRIDPANPAVAPLGNPFPASATPLTWASGLRNPWRFSFDEATGDLYLADVGQNSAEEINLQPAGLAGLNYGWRCMEGTLCTGLSGCLCNDPALRLPLHTYAHTGGVCAVVGGVVYRGSSIPALQGSYFFADYCSGRIWTLVQSAGVVQSIVERTAQLAPGGLLAIQNPVAFGSDASGNVYILDQSGGEIFRIEEVCSTPSVYCPSLPNSTGFGASISAVGSASLSQNNLSILTVTCPPNVTGLYFYGSAQAQVPLGNGFRCIGGSIVRLPVIQTDAFGDAVQTVLPGTIPGLQPGVTRYFQFWYRDPSGGGAGFNLSDGLCVPFCN